MCTFETNSKDPVNKIDKYFELQLRVSKYIITKFFVLSKIISTENNKKCRAHKT